MEIGTWTGTQVISIHAPAKERQGSRIKFSILSNFNPRSCEGATLTTELSSIFDVISIHAPAKERLDFEFKIGGII